MTRHLWSSFNVQKKVGDPWVRMTDLSLQHINMLDCSYTRHTHPAESDSSYRWQTHCCGSESGWGLPARWTGRALTIRAAACTWSRWSWLPRSGACSDLSLWPRAALAWRAGPWRLAERPAWRAAGVSGSAWQGGGRGPVLPGAAGRAAWSWGTCPCLGPACRRARRQGL